MRLLIKNADWIITMDEKRRRLQNCDILIEDQKIIAIGENLEEDDSIDEVIRGEGKVIIPGLVNTHHHFFQSLTRNIPELNFNLTLEEWLDVNYRVFQHVDEEELEAASTVAMGELLKTGCTTTTDQHYVFTRRENRMIDTEIMAAKRLGMRFQPTRASISIGKSNGNYVPDRMAQSLDDILYDSERLITAYHDPSDYAMVRIGLGPCNYALDSTPEAMRETLSLARKYKVRCHSHLAESPGETEIALERFGCRPAEYVEKMGWLGEDIWFAHCTQLNDREIELFAKTGTSVANCPASNMQTGVTCPVSRMLKAGVAVGLAVDGSGSNNASNMMTEMRISYLVNLLTSNGIDLLTSQQILELATIGAARVLGRSDIGSLEPGRAADLVLLDWSQLQYAGGQGDPVECIILSGDSKMVDTVIVNGKVRVKKGRLTGLDEEREAAHINEVGRKWLRMALETR